MLLDLFFSFFLIGAFSFGGGFAMLPLIQQELVVKHHWLSLGEFTDITALAGAAPGAVAVNMATYGGYKLAGLPGAVAALTGVVLPSFILILTLAGLVIKNKDNLYFLGAFRGLRPVVVALVIGAAVLVGRNAITSFPGVLIAVAVFLLLRFTRIHPIFLVLGSGLFGMFLF